MKLSKHRRKGEFDRTQNMLITVSMKARKQGIKPWDSSPLGQHGFDPIGMATCLVFKTMRQLSFDELVDYLKDTPKLLESLYLKKVPSRSALHASFCRIREDFITWIHQQTWYERYSVWRFYWICNKWSTYMVGCKKWY
ncbi:MAG: hypothetical protein K8823_1237 [Cenarchaeum symbiont of Oopsacas minuta]|nr:hypothetical protein [Cenarchaeum symbiont of Oopsacas minuta]